ncbi:MAG: flagellar biosynthesis protein FlhB [Sphingomonadales bacterium]
MADDTDDSQKTEDPSAKKLQEAYDKGDAPRSQEVKTWFMLLAGLALVSIFSGSMARDVKNALTGFLAQPHAIDLSDSGAAAVFRGLTTDIATMLILPVIILVIAAVAGSVVQGHIVFTAEKIKPKLSKISPASGLKKLISLQSVTELLKSVAKLIVVGGAFGFILWPERNRLGSLITMSPEDLLGLIFVLTVKLGIAVVAIMGAVAAADYSFQRFQFMKRMRMSIKEVRDEHKQLEGDPQVKSRIAKVRQERSRHRIAQAVPEADVIITNPTHYAVALKYEHGKMQVPVLLAKGVDHLAARIREIAGEHEIPILENPPLARSLYATVEIDEEIQPEHYKAVAKVVSYLLALRKNASTARYTP